MQYYNDEPDIGTAFQITFSSPTMRTGVNATLAAGASISGTVTAPGAVNDEGVCVLAYAGTAGYFEALAGTNSAGAYDITNLPADTYKIAFEPGCGLVGSDFDVSWYNGEASFPAATTETLSTGETLSGVNVTLGLLVSPLSISTTSLPSGTMSSAYSATLSATGGGGAYDWTASGLPAGLSISASTGAITGTPTVSGGFTALITVTDASTPVVQATTSLSLSIVSPPPPPTTTTTTTVVPITQTVCTAKTKTVTIHKVEVKNSKKITVTVREKVRVYKTVTIKKTEKIHGKKVVVITHKSELVKVCKTVIV
jgi:hypothetical protein